MNVEWLIQKIYARRPVRIILHTVFWFLLSIIQWYLTSISFNPNRAFPDPVVVLMILANTFSIVLFYYPFVYFVLSKVILKKKYALACVLTLLLVVIYGLSDVFKEEWIIKNCISCMDSLQASNKDFFNFLHTGLFNRLFLKLSSMGIIIGL